MDVIEFDDEGFLRVPSQWDSELATNIAKENDIELSDAHWTVIDAARSFYAKTGISPSMRPLIKIVEREDASIADSITLAQLFTPQVTRLVAQISGLPKPSDCL
ncbi:MAG: TusE/DsrC/DsvC family sulfur relay protein [Gammaproteobacteria bacterium]|nr:TusE/DsrC/DsvC family sulfur relay protein [Gammaproteobacteria bacterium]MYC25818.1 TusE/DsrC/DsvC family sulfur relay protein [Gammaproteobacteria bacterium]